MKFKTVDDEGATNVRVEAASCAVVRRYAANRIPSPDDRADHRGPGIDSGAAMAAGASKYRTDAKSQHHGWKLNPSKIRWRTKPAFSAKFPWSSPEIRPFYLFSLARCAILATTRGFSQRKTPAMPSGPPRSEMEIELSKLSSPRIFLVRMLVFLVLCALVMVVLYKQIVTAFFANPGLNALIGAVLLIGIILSFRQVIRLYPEVAWVNNFRIADPGLALDRRPTLLAPMAAILGGERSGRMTISQQTMRHLLDSIATRLDEARDISRYMTGLLVFLGLLGTFWGLIETVGSVGKVIEGLKVGGDGGSLFDKQ